jgi:hypothetical protein
LLWIVSGPCLPIGELVSGTETIHLWTTVFVKKNASPENGTGGRVRYRLLGQNSYDFIIL